MHRPAWPSVDSTGISKRHSLCSAFMTPVSPGKKGRPAVRTNCALHAANARAQEERKQRASTSSARDARRAAPPLSGPVSHTAPRGWDSQQEPLQAGLSTPPATLTARGRDSVTVCGTSEHSIRSPTVLPTATLSFQKTGTLGLRFFT